MQKLIEKYSDFQATQRSTHLGPAENRTIVLTGATGLIGVLVLAHLVASSEVDTVYCLVRAKSDESAIQRVKLSLFQNRLHHTLSLEDRAKIVSLRSDLSKPNLGLSTEIYKAITAKLTNVIHCAWTMKFELCLLQDDIAGVHQLLKLCIASSASFDFCSSTSTMKRCPTKHIPEQLAELEWMTDSDLDYDYPGYAQSKCVAEHLCAAATKKTGIKTRILRIGQVIANATHGIWRYSQIIPFLIQFASAVEALPMYQDFLSFMPVELVAKAVSEIALSDAESIVANIMGKTTFSWADELLPALRQAGIGLATVEPETWICMLSECSSLPDLIKQNVGKMTSISDSDMFGSSRTYETTVARTFSSSLERAPKLDAALVEAFKSYFRVLALPKKPALISNLRQLIIIIAGPCGSGKSTLANKLSLALRCPEIEGDSLHSIDAVSKMADGIPLTDEDRIPWLHRVKECALKKLNDLGFGKVIVTCSALKKMYRDIFRSLEADGVPIVFLDLQVGKDELVRRMQNRQGHFMKAGMVDSQIAVYEPPTPEEMDVLHLDAKKSVEDLEVEVLELLEMYRDTPKHQSRFLEMDMFAGGRPFP